MGTMAQGSRSLTQGWEHSEVGAWALVAMESETTGVQESDVEGGVKQDVSPHGLGGESCMNAELEELELLGQNKQLVQAVRQMGTGVEEIDLAMGPADDDMQHFDPDSHNLIDHGLKPNPRKKKKVVKKWRHEWTETYKWAYVAVCDGIHRIFCSVCKEYGRKHRRNPYGNEGSRNMQMSALEEHNNSLLHKEAVRLQMASKDKGFVLMDRSAYIKGRPMAQYPISSERDPMRWSSKEAYFQPPLAPTDLDIDCAAMVLLAPFGSALMSRNAESILTGILRRDPHEVEFIQAVQEVVHSLEPVFSKIPQFVRVLERLVEPERVVIFRVPWVDDKGEAHVNRAFRVQFNQALGPYKGGLRFHPGVNLSVMKFLAFEQTLKNSLTSLNLGGAKGGSDFDPRGKSENEITRFCQSFMEELYRHIGPNQVPIFDTPSGDIGVGPREIGYLFGQYRRLSTQFEAVLSGKGVQWGGTALRLEATGFGVVYYAKEVLADLDKDLKGLRCAVSGAGKVATYAVEKLLAFGAIPVTISDSSGYLLDDEGFDYGKLALIRDIKAHGRSLREFCKNYPRTKYHDGSKPWGVKCDIAFPCATQNELDHADAMALVGAGCQVVVEGANMPCTTEAIEVFRKSKVLFGPGKAANCGGVAVAGYEAIQNASRAQLSPEDVDIKLQEIMKDVYRKCLKAASDYGIAEGDPEALLHGANIAGFLRVAQAMLEQGCV